MSASGQDQHGMLQADGGSGSSRGLLNLFPSLGYSSILPSVLRNSLLRSESSSSRPSSSDTRPSEVGSLSGSSVSTTDAEVSVSRGADHDAVDDIPSTSGREDSDATSDGESAAAAVAAERHRLSSASNIDLQALAKWVEKTAPYLGLLCVVFVYNHYTGLAIFAWLTLVVHKANEITKKQVSLKAEFQKGVCTALAASLACHAPMVMLLLQPEHLWQRFVLVTPSTGPTFWSALFWVTTVDLLARHFGIAAKLAVVVSWSCRSAEGFRRRAQCLTWIENLTLLYRAILPIPVWYKFFEASGMGMILCAMATGVYLLLKCGRLVEQSALVAASAKAVLLREAAYGNYAKPEEVMEAGNHCSICQEPMTDPIRLHCSHIYCDKCISEWFERERTCPMCRAVIKPAGLHSFGDGSTMQLPQCF